MSEVIDETRRAQIADETLQALQDCRALLSNDHFVYISGDHGSGWIDADAIFPHTELVARLGAYLAQVTAAENVEVVCGPVTGGLIISQVVARELNALAVFAEHDRALGLAGKFVLRRGFEKLVQDKRVLVVDDVVNTGHSLRQTVAAVKQVRGDVVGVAALVNRGKVAAGNLGAPRFDFLLQFDIPAWPAATCRLCRQGTPVNTRFAHGEEFVRQLRAPDE